MNLLCQNPIGHVLNTGLMGTQAKLVETIITLVLMMDYILIIVYLDQIQERKLLMLMHMWKFVQFLVENVIGILTGQGSMSCLIGLQK